MENNDGNLAIVVLGLVVSLLGNIMQFFLPIKKGKEDVSETLSSTAKNIAEAYTMTLNSLQKRILDLEEERKEDIILIKALEEKLHLQEERLELQEEEIKSLRKIIESYQKNDN